MGNFPFSMKFSLFSHSGERSRCGFQRKEGALGLQHDAPERRRLLLGACSDDGPGGIDQRMVDYLSQPSSLHGHDHGARDMLREQDTGTAIDGEGIPVYPFGQSYVGPDHSVLETVSSDAPVEFRGGGLERG